MRLSVVIPVYNEINTLEELLNKVLEVADIEKEIILVDDGSTDGSKELMLELKQKHPEIVIHFKEQNSGKGATLREGFKLATGDYVIVQDADLEYDPQDYYKLLAGLENTDADVIYGSRFSGNYEDMSNLHYYGNKALTLITNLFFGVMLTDMETCYKLIPTSFLHDLEIESQRFNFEPEITAKILKAGLKIREIPISYKGRSHEEGKKISWFDGISALTTLLKFRFFK